MAPTSWSRNKKLVLTWTALLVLFVASGVVLIVAAEVFRQGSAGELTALTLRRLVWTRLFSDASVVLGVLMFLTAALGLQGFWSGGAGRGDRNGGLIYFNWALVFTTLVTIVVGSIIWFYTLTERADYETIWLRQSPRTVRFLQDTLSCCGYWNATTTGLSSQRDGFCAAPRDLIAVTPCVTPLTAYADHFLSNVFSTIYGFVAIELFLVLTTCCLVINRSEEARFARIDEKQGKRGGFV